MSRKDFVLIAAIVAKVGGDARERLAIEFADALTATNPRFDRARFLKACLA